MSQRTFFVTVGFVVAKLKICKRGIDTAEHNRYFVDDGDGAFFYAVQNAVLTLDFNVLVPDIVNHSRHKSHIESERSARALSAPPAYALT